MTQLLVSVRSATEAEAALAGGADLIDVKEPNQGSLGRACAKVLEEVADAVGNQSILSAALGELNEPLDAATLHALRRYQFAKVGLAYMGSRPDWRQRWAEAVHCLPAATSPVAVVYADGRYVDSPPVDEIIAQASQLKCRALLVDTFTKDGRNLFDHWRREQVADFVQFARQRSMLSVLAGALDTDTARIAAGLRPDYVAVRSAVCKTGRTGSIQTSLVANCAAAIQQEKSQIGTTKTVR